MSPRHLLSLVVIAGLGLGVAVFRAVSPSRFEAIREGTGAALGWVPEPVLLGGVLLYVVVTWVAAMLLLATLLYRCWRQVDDLVLGLWDRLLPESPIVRFGVGLTLMIFVFGFGPLLFLQATDLGESDQDVEERLDGNQTETDANETSAPSDDETNRTDELDQVKGVSQNTIPLSNIIPPSKGPYL